MATAVEERARPPPNTTAMGPDAPARAMVTPATAASVMATCTHILVFNTVYPHDNKLWLHITAQPPGLGPGIVTGFKGMTNLRPC